MEELVTGDGLFQYKEFFNRHVLMCGLWIAAGVMLIYTQIRIMMARVRKTSAGNATLLVNHEGGIFVDVRATTLFDQGHIANAVNISAADIKAGRLTRIESYKEQPVILVGKDKYDGDCFASACLLKKQGYTQVYTLEGGVNQWQMDNLPLTTRR